MNKPKLILLPGLDGTGLLFKPLTDILPSEINYQVIPLSSLLSDEPAAQAKEIARLLGNEPCILFAESYSGLIAYELCRQQQADIKHVIFAASFLDKPSAVSRFAALLPLWPIRRKLVPAGFMNRLLFGNTDRKNLLPLFYSAFDIADPAALKARLQRISKLEPPAGLIHQPCTYICAADDWLVSKNALTDFKRLCTQLDIAPVNGGHLVAQGQPDKCVAIIQDIYSL
ncbi:alpha/beta hydrolase [Chromatiaceae bacterium AAb-1]|nr:alpha/beta hydrolase [Chromatiaceae bacterium AAb-1]